MFLTVLWWRQVEWLQPYTDAKIRELGASGVKQLLAVPISFVSEHIETLEEIDMEYRELALESGVQVGTHAGLCLRKSLTGQEGDSLVPTLILRKQRRFGASRNSFSFEIVNRTPWSHHESSKRCS